MAGVADFDPENWRRRDGAEPAKVANPAKDEATLATLAALAADELPETIERGLRRLRTMTRPTIVEPGNWPVIVRDCLALGSDGWAARALALGWHPLNLWGVSATVGGRFELEGLGVWLSGRRILLLDELSCIATTKHEREVFHRRPMEGATLIWELGGGGR